MMSDVESQVVDCIKLHSLTFQVATSTRRLVDYHDDDDDSTPVVSSSSFESLVWIKT